MMEVIEAATPEYVRKYREKHKEEIAQKRRELYKRKKEERAAAQREAMENMLSEKTENEAIRAAKINQEHGYSFVCAASHREDGRTVIVEKVRMPFRSWQYRVKTVNLEYFPTLCEAIQHCQKKRVVFQFVCDDTESENEETFQFDQNKEVDAI